MATALRVLIVEDSPDDAELVLRELRRGGYAPEHRIVEGAAAFREAIETPNWELILCDYTLSDFDGVRALELVRERGIDVPFIFVSGTIGEATAVAAMRAGAKDYVVKDNLRRLVPAIERELREAEARRQRKLAEAERRVAELRFREVLAMAPDAIVAADAAQRITIFNRSAEELFGYDAEEVAGRPLDLLLPARFGVSHRRQVLEFAHAPAVVRRIGERGEVVGRRKNGEEFPAEASISKIAENGTTMFLAVVRDITQRQQFEERLRQSQRMEAVGQLTGGLAHDFNNLLTIIIGNLELLMPSLSGNPAAKDLAELALNASHRGARLTHQLLAYSRRQSLETVAFDLNHLVSGTMELLRRTLGERILVEMVLAERLAAALADPAQVESALVNLAINARDAMPDGGPLTIETANRHLDADYAAHNPDVAPGSYVMLAVSDTGIGIPTGIINRVFEPFFTTKESGKGSGLGLSMVYGFAKQSGGHVQIESEVGRGTTVRLYLPRSTRKAEVPEAGRMPESVQEARHATVLVVDDDPGVRMVAVQAMRALGYQVLEAEDGHAALALLAEDRPVDLLFSDVMLPRGMTGPDLAREACRRRPGLKVLFTSGFSDLDIAGAAGELGSLLAKPYRLQDLAQKVREVLA